MCERGVLAFVSVSMLCVCVCMNVYVTVSKSLKQDWAYIKTLPFWTVIKGRINHSVRQHWQNLKLSDTACQSVISCLSHCLLSILNTVLNLHCALPKPDIHPVSHFPVSRELIILFPTCILFAVQLLLHLNVGYQAIQRRSIPISSLDFQDCSDFPAYCFSQKLLKLKIHSLL